ncbi:MAG TPA: metal ABC transporter substrate-binding protein [Vicinamibacteria bacterium]|nr:metal ABC transporter substrate-binding protein [Vicinamibacteria bacterium]
MSQGTNRRGSRAGIGAIWLTLLAGAAPSSAADVLQVVATLPDLADIARQVGQERAEVSSIAVGFQDPHYVDPKPSFVVKLNRADVFIQVGLDLEIGWVPPLLNQARNPRVIRGGPGWIDASEGVEILERPTREMSRAEGDIHIYGNPHYWMDPLNGKIIAAHIARVFSSLRPEWASEFEHNRDVFARRIDEANERWQARMAPHHGTPVVAYHNSWPYFERRFGIEIAGFVEPRPGIPPTPNDLLRVINLMKSKNIKMVLHSIYYDDKPARFVAQKVGAEVVTLATSVGGGEGVEDYIKLFDYNVGLLVDAFERTGPAR